MYIIDYDFPICVRFPTFLSGSCYLRIMCGAFMCLPNDQIYGEDLQAKYLSFCCHRWLNEFLVVKLMCFFGW